GGQFLLRIEDIDTPRCKPDFEQAIHDDLSWLGLRWPAPVMRQSERMADYEAALNKLGEIGVTYPCSCTRGDIRAALSAPQEGAPMQGPDGVIYPGTCRGREMESRLPGDAIRLDMAKAMALVGALAFTETGPAHTGLHHITAAKMIETVGDVVLARKDIGTYYHIAVVVDDAAQGITHVVRGEDLFSATPIHILLQRLLGLAQPIYHHHRLIRDEAGKRLAKRDDARAIRLYREQGKTPEDIRARLGL
ncbi:MAG: tRNA glutamyl-Q(34) synthetase GluQRS, partial [Maritimibacter sp.]